MPKVGMEPIRREALIQATIAEIGAKGTLDITVSAIARRAGVSPALAHHYFGGKEQLFLSTMRHILSVYGADVREALRGAQFGMEPLPRRADVAVQQRPDPDADRAPTRGAGTRRRGAPQAAAAVERGADPDRDRRAAQPRQVGYCGIVLLGGKKPTNLT